MSEPRFPIPEMEAVRTQLAEAAQREAQRDDRSLWRRAWFGHRVAVVLAGLVVGGGAVAAATQLISVGEPVKPYAPFLERYRPGNTEPAIVVRAPDTELGLPWGLAVYDSAEGQRCVLAGQLRISKLGVVENGSFRPFSRGTGGACGQPKSDGLFTDIRSFGTEPPRTLLFGRAGDNVRRVRLVVGPDVSIVTVGQGGGFLFVLDARPDLRQTHLEPLDRNGRRLR